MTSARNDPALDADQKAVAEAFGKAGQAYYAGWIGVAVMAIAATHYALTNILNVGHVIFTIIGVGLMGWSYISLNKLGSTVVDILYQAHGVKPRQPKD